MVWEPFDHSEPVCLSSECHLLGLPVPDCQGPAGSERMRSLFWVGSSLSSSCSFRMKKDVVTRCDADAGHSSDCHLAVGEEGGQGYGWLDRGKDWRWMRA